MGCSIIFAEADLLKGSDQFLKEVINSLKEVINSLKELINSLKEVINSFKVLHPPNIAAKMQSEVCPTGRPRTAFQRQSHCECKLPVCYTVNAGLDFCSKIIHISPHV